jgi:hypothetical protein
MVGDTLPRNQWQKGTVDSVFPSSHGLVRKSIGACDKEW